MTQITINGNTYSDDGSSPKDMQHYGYLQHLLPMIGDTATVAGHVVTAAEEAQEAAAMATDAALAMRGTSTSSLTVAAGSVTLTTQEWKQFAPGNYVTISRTSAPETLMHGVVTAYSGTALTVSVSTAAGSGTFTDWTIALSGAKGADGPSGNGQLVRVVKTEDYMVTAADKGQVIECSGTFTLSFQACATLGTTWTTFVRNSGSGTVTLDPYGSETIDGQSTFLLDPGITISLVSDGANLSIVSGMFNALRNLKLGDAKPAGYNFISALLPAPFDYVAAPAYMTDIKYVGGKYFLHSTSAATTLAVSSDGETYILRTLPQSMSVMEIVWDGTYYLASNSAGQAWARSTDAVTWESVNGPSAVADYGYKITAVNGVILSAVSDTTNGVKIVKSTDHGSTWALALQGMHGNISGIILNGSTHVLLGGASYRGILRTTDSGSSYTEIANVSGGTTRLAGARSGNTMLAVGTYASGHGVSYSINNGVTWADASGPSATMYAVATNGTVFVVVGTSGGIHTATVATPGTFTAASSGTANTLNSVIYANGKFVAVGSSGTIRTSTTGTGTWTTVTSGTANDLFAVAYFNGAYYASGQNNTLLTSTDAVTWTAVTAPGTSTLSPYICSNGTVLVYYYSNVNVSTYYTTTDGTNWTERTCTRLNGGTSWTFDGSTLYLVETSGVMKTTDFVNYTPCAVFSGTLTANSQSQAGSLAWMYTNNLLLKSTNGTSWTAHVAPIPNASTIFYDGSLYWSNGYSSPDMVTWTQVTSVNSAPFFSSFLIAGQATGWGGIRYPDGTTGTYTHAQTFGVSGFPDRYRYIYRNGKAVWVNSTNNVLAISTNQKSALIYKEA